MFYAEADVFELVDLLFNEHYLDSWREADLKKINAAFQDYVDALLRVASYDESAW